MNVEHMSRKVFKAIFFSVKIGFVAFAMFVGCTGLRLTNMTAPVVQDPKEDMKFYCEYDMGGEELYAVKWYKDDMNSFAGNPNSVEFQVKGVHVDSRRTHCEDSSCTLYLNNLSRTFSSGAYRCEVSSEAPAFRLASQTHNVSIAVLPKQNPHIEGLSENYLIGDFLNISCISGLGDPKPTVSWYINKNPVDNKYIREPTSKTSLIHEEGGVILQRSSLQLHFPLDREVTKNKEFATIEVACIQTVGDLNPAFVPSRVTKKDIVVSSEHRLVKNQKLYGFFSNNVHTTDMNFFLLFFPTCSIICVLIIM
ncbi:hypothetical protein WA026_023614 [Henosepilachna vigintioctopunctata]|uniref:Ig-like domain-containing protein n=1 Tax=Henosepilachna vigintioctopunctata TaxID=420089 RepID=A0AAW1U147_9CUCU